MCAGAIVVRFGVRRVAANTTATDPPTITRSMLDLCSAPCKARRFAPPAPTRGLRALTVPARRSGSGNCVMADRGRGVWANSTAARSAQLHQGGDRIIDECLEARPVRSKQPLDIICGAVANAQPHDLRRGALGDTEAVKVLVLCDQDASEIDRALPHCFVRRTAQADVANVHRIRTQILKLPEQGFRQLLVEEHPHG